VKRALLILALAIDAHADVSAPTVSGSDYEDADIHLRWPRTLPCRFERLTAIADRPIDLVVSGAGAPTLRIQAYSKDSDGELVHGGQVLPVGVPPDRYTRVRLFEPTGRPHPLAVVQLSAECREPIAIQFGYGDPTILYSPSEPLPADGSLDPGAGSTATTRALGVEIAALLSSWKGEHSARIEDALAITRRFANPDERPVVVPDPSDNSDWNADATLGDDQLTWRCYALRPPSQRHDRALCMVNLRRAGRFVAQYVVAPSDGHWVHDDYVQSVWLPGDGGIVMNHSRPSRLGGSLPAKIFGVALELSR
jgi:hypothetical protein